MASFDSIINKAKKDWNCSSLMDGARAARGDKIPFSSPLLNYATYGGIPRKRITIFYGNYGGGKSTSAADICKHACKIFKTEFDAELSRLRDAFAAGNKALASEIEDLEARGPKRVLYVDLEHTFDEDWARTLGIDVDCLEIMQPPDIAAEDLLEVVKSLIESGEVGLIVLDSVPSLVTRAELEKKFGERTVASAAGLLTTFCRKITPVLTRYDCTMIVINQIRDNMDNPYVVNMPGGNALKFYASLMMQFRIGSPVDFLGNELPQSAENPAGYIINVKLTKQKSAPFDRKNASYYLMAQSGIRIDMDFAQLAVNKYQIIRKAGAWFTICDPITKQPIEDASGNEVKLQGMAKVLDYMQQNTEYFQRLQDVIMADIEGKSAEEVEDVN